MWRPALAPLRCHVDADAATKAVARSYDLPFSGSSSFRLPLLPRVPADFGIGVIVGPSGSGKSSLLRARFAAPRPAAWSRTKAIVSHFADAADAMARLSAVGLNSTRSWLKPHHVLSTGEQFRADVARALGDGATFDEFTSALNRDAARSACIAVAKLVLERGYRRIVLAACHDDIVPWLRPDWVFSTEEGKLFRHPFGATSHPRVRLTLDVDLFALGAAAGRMWSAPSVFSVRRCEQSLWPLFAPHHYLSPILQKSCQCYVAVSAAGKYVAFCAVMSMLHRKAGHAMREHRLVVLPDFQGMGLGPRFSDAIAGLWASTGKKYYSKTSHPRLGEYRERSALWRSTSVNLSTVNPSGKWSSNMISSTAARELVSVERSEGAAARPRSTDRRKYDELACDACGSAENDEAMLLCDRCDRGFHMWCLEPKLAAVPDDAWFCDECRHHQTNEEARVCYSHEYIGHEGAGAPVSCRPQGRPPACTDSRPDRRAARSLPSADQGQRDSKARARRKRRRSEDDQCDADVARVARTGGTRDREPRTVYGFRDRKLVKYADNDDDSGDDDSDGGGGGGGGGGDGDGSNAIS